MALNGTFKIRKNSNFIAVPKAHLYDPNLSLEAKGLYSMIIAESCKKCLLTDELVAMCKEDKPTVLRTLSELEKSGHLE